MARTRKTAGVKRIDGCYGGYTGQKLWKVKHPAFKNTVTVFAPSEEAAIVAAADAWGVKWNTLGFYSFCEVKPEGDV